jgi:hypothetical protein
MLLAFLSITVLCSSSAFYYVALWKLIHHQQRLALLALSSERHDLQARWNIQLMLQAHWII